MTELQESWQEMDALYVELQPQLWRILASNLRIADDVIEDACQSAWGSLLAHRSSIAPGHELGWLSTTATREALRVVHARREVVPLDDGDDQPARLDEHRNSAIEPDRALELSEKLAEVRALPLRQRRIVWLQGLGYEYAEIAAVTGESCRTVERQLTRARRRLTQLGDAD